MFRLQSVLCVAVSTQMATASFAAEVVPLGVNDAGKSVVAVTGDLAAGDLEVFAAATQSVTSAVIVLSSNGGNLQTGLDIGERIRMRGFETAVPDGAQCHSACALAWLGGTSRYLGLGSLVTFHAAYTMNDGEARETGLGNALVGSYAAKLGLEEGAVMFLTSAPPSGFNELTQEWAEQTGITAVFGSTSNLTATVNENTEENNEEQTLSDAQLAQIIDQAEAGDVEAQFALGYRFNHGKGVDKDVQRSIHFYTLAANSGDDRAQNNLGQIYLRGDGVAVDVKAAASWFQKAANKGNLKASYSLGRMYLSGSGVEENEVEAVRLIRIAASGGESQAQYMLGLAYQNGWGVTIDEKQAFDWFLRAAEQELPAAQVQVGYAYKEARGTVIDYDAAFQWISRAASNNYADAQVALSRMYDEGIGVAPDPSLAAKWMSAAALAGDDFAIYMLAWRFDEGDGVSRSGKSAARYLINFLSSDHEKRVEWVLEDGPTFSPDTIFNLQGMLAERGLYEGPLDGTYGRGTAAAIRAFAASP